MDTSALIPDLLFRSSRRSVEALGYLKNLINTRNDIEEKYAKKLQQWADKNRVMLRKSDPDAVALDDPVIEAVECYLMEGIESANSHKEVARIATMGTLASLTRMVKRAEDINQVYTEYQAVYDTQQKLFEKATKSREKYLRSLQKHQKLVRQLEDTLKALRGPAGLMSGAKRMIRKTESRLTDSEAVVNLAKTKYESHCKREQSHREQFVEDVKRYTDMITTYRTERTDKLLSELHLLLQTYSALYLPRLEAKNSPAQRLMKAKQILGLTDTNKLVYKWQSRVSERIKFLTYLHDIESPDVKMEEDQEELQEGTSASCTLDTATVKTKNGECEVETETPQGSDMHAEAKVSFSSVTEEKCVYSTRTIPPEQKESVISAQDEISEVKEVTYVQRFVDDSTSDEEDFVKACNQMRANRPKAW